MKANSPLFLSIFLYFTLLSLPGVRGFGQITAPGGLGDTFNPSKIKASRDLSILYFKTAVPLADSFSLSFLVTDNPEKHHFLNFQAYPLFWIPADSGLLIIGMGDEQSGEQLYFQPLKGETKKLNLGRNQFGKNQFGESQFGEQAKGEPIIRINLIRASVKDPSLWGLTIESRSENKSGIYTYHIKNGTLKKVAPFYPGKVVFMDGELKPVAAQQSNEEGSDTLFKFDAAGESLIPFVFPSAIDSLSPAGFSKILSVSDKGDFVFYISNEGEANACLFAFNTLSRKSTRLASAKGIDLLPYGASFNQRGEITSVIGFGDSLIRKCPDPTVENDFEYLEKELIPSIVKKPQHSSGKELESSIKKEHNHSIVFVSTNENDRKWIVSSEGNDQKYYYLFDRKTKNVTLLISSKK